jgi:hypothetical protein
MNDALENKTKAIIDLTEFLHLKHDSEELKKIKVPEGYSLVNIEEATDKIDTLVDAAVDQAAKAATRFGVGGFIIGAALSGAVTYFVTRRMLETKYNQIAEEEIADMRQHYRDKELALENDRAKPELDKLVRERGYSSQPPMAVTPPDAVVEAAEATTEIVSDPRPPVPVPPREENIFQKSEPTEWDYEKERSRRTDRRPYIVHRDEVRENEDYDTTTYTYYEEDDVLCNERDEVIGKDERDALIGEAHLNQFGHGSGDPSIVYIRNDRLEMQMEVIRSPNAFIEEVHGFEHSEDWRPRRRPRERHLRDDE